MKVHNKFIKAFGALLVVALLFVALPLGKVKAAEINVDCSGGCDQTQIQTAIDSAGSGDIVNVSGGPIVLTAGVTVKTGVTLNGVGNPLIQVSGTGDRFTMQDGSTLQGFQIEKTDKTGLQNIIYVGSDNVSVLNNTIWGRYVFGDPEVSRAFEVAYGSDNLTISGNTIYDLRQPGYLNGSLASPTTGTISNNNVYSTRGWVLAGANMSYTGNTWGDGSHPNIFDIVILSGTDASYYSDIVAVSNANNMAVVEDQRVSPAVLSVAYVDASAPAGGNGGAAQPYQTINEGITRVITGGTVKVAAGAYTNMSLNKPVTLLGPNAGIHPAVGTHQTETVGTRGPEAIVGGVAEPSADGVTLDGFKFSKAGTRMIDTYADADNFTMRNCIVESTVNNPTTAVMQFGGGSHINMLIEFNLFMDEGDHTFYTGGGPYDGMTFQYNKFQGAGDSFFWTATPLVNGVIKGNEFDGESGSNFNTINIGKAGNLQLVNNWFHGNILTGAQVGVIDGTISGNIFEETYAYSTYWGSGLELWGGQYGTAVSTNVTITGNEFHYNDILGAGYPSHGIRLRAPEGTSGSIDGSTIHIYCNEFYDGGERTDAYAIWDQTDQTSPVDADANYWGTATPDFTGKFNGSVTYLPYNTDDTCGTPVYPPVHNITQDTWFYEIQTAIDAAIDGDIIEVGPGTYNEQIVLDVPNITVRSTGGAATTIIDIPDGTLTTGVKTFKNLGVITFNGFTVKDFTESGIIQGYGEREGTTFHVLNNIVIPAADYLRNGIQVSGQGSTVIGNTVYGAYLTEDYASTCIGVVNASEVTVEGNTIYGPADSGIAVYSYTGDVSDVDVTENTVTGVDYPLIVDAYYSGSTVTGVDFYRNIVTDYIVPMSAVPYPGYDGGPITDVDATFNYWGYACGPTVVVGDVPYSPWYVDNTLTTTSDSLGAPGTYIFTAGATTEQMQADINCAAPGSVFNFESGSYPGGLVIGRDELTFNLNGVTVGHGSSAFDIYGDDITINGPGIIDGTGSASTDNAILVEDGADNLIVDGVEVRNWTEAINVVGSHESFKLVNNWIHSNAVGFLTGSESLFTGVVTIEGNLFKANTTSFIHNGVESLEAEYNSWGAVGGPTDVVGLVDFEPWTFSEIYFDMIASTPAEETYRHVAVTQSFDVAIKAEAANLYGLSFVFEYDETKLALANTVFAAPWDGSTGDGATKCVQIPGLPNGQVGYYCNLFEPQDEWNGGTIATFTFTAIGPAAESFFDIYSDDSLSSGAVGGVKVWVNNAGFNAPSIPKRDVTDTDDGKLTIDSANFTGFIDLQGRPNDSGALVEVFDASTGGTLMATATSESSGKYITAYEPGLWMVVSFVAPDNVDQPYYITVDRDLFLPTALWEVNLTESPGLTELNQLLLLGGDATDNNEIDIADASCIGNAYGGSTNMCTGGAGANSDVNGDGIVNIYDLTLMGGNYAKTESTWSPQ